MNKTRAGGSVLAMTVVMACGGDGATPDATPTPDAPSTADAATIDAATIDAVTPIPDSATTDAVSVTCLLDPNYPSLTLASAAAPFEFAAQRTANGENAIVLLGTLAPDPPRKALLMIMIDNTGMFAAAGGMGPMAGGPTGTGIPLDSGATCGGCIEGYADYELMGGNADLATAQQIYQIESGALTLDTFNPGAVDLGTSDVFGSYTAVTLLGYSPDPLDPTVLVPNGCVTTIDALNFFFRPTWQPATVAPVLGSSRVPTVDIRTD